MSEQQPKPNLTTPAAVTRSQQVYSRVVTGQCKDAPAELAATHGTSSKQK